MQPFSCKKYNTSLWVHTDIFAHLRNIHLVLNTEHQCDSKVTEVYLNVRAVGAFELQVADGLVDFQVEDERLARMHEKDDVSYGRVKLDLKAFLEIGVRLR